ncbi:glycoside hydrolase family 28 protein [Coleophoma crateriformis]|uniref:Glycoside hydrolase family 28 protein n=1 Tax=Coleophoma crateriformis TaxID=565419 RepID=A0A3D8QYN1_9HELO|nr:glycoside hydrolase family 28 protein [Coleophoma crateriformis]
MQFFNSQTLALSSLLFLVANAAPSPTLKQRNLDAVSLAKRASCTPTAGGASSVDDVPAIESAIASCGSGGTIVIPAGKNYYLNSMLDFSECKSCTFNIEGTLTASNNLTYWATQTAMIYMKDIAGATIQSLTGSGVIDGNGQAAWESFAQDSSLKRPTLHYIDGGSNIVIQNLAAKNPPNVFFSVKGDATNVQYDSLTMTAKSDSDTAPKNTDGFDIGASTYTTLTNITVSNQDDCVAFKPGANYVTVDTITCTGSHGLSVGSLGSTNTDTVQNVYVTGATMIDSTKAVGIKLYPGGSSHGQGVVSNVTYDGVTVTNCDYAAQIQTCYGEDATYCTTYPSTGTIAGVVFKNFKGTTSTKYAPATANLDCSSAGTCGVTISNWSVKAGSGTAEVLCANTPSTLGVTCTDGASG